MPHRILIVEDEALIGLDLALMLEDAGYETVGIARDMHGALEIAANEQIHLATMDIQLAGGTNGIDTALSLRSTYGIPCIFISGSIDDQNRLRAAAAEPVAFIQKPILSDDVLGAIAAYLARSSD